VKRPNGREDDDYMPIDSFLNTELYLGYVYDDLPELPTEGIEFN